MKVGVDKISFYVPEFYLDMCVLAEQRGADSNKYLKGLWQEKMSVLPPNQDIVTMGANAAQKIIADDDKKTVDLLIFATESALDYSKSAGIYVHELIGLNKNCRVVEVKQACYGSTAALRFAINHVKLNPKSKVLVIASDVARYGMKTAGEPTQGCGAVAMIVASNPSILAIDDEVGFVTKDVMDFWRPSHMKEAIVDGPYSKQMYLDSLIDSWQMYKEVSDNSISSFDKLCFHLPFSKIGKKAMIHLSELENMTIDDNVFNMSKEYNKVIGNTYTASLYIALISQLENTKEDLSGKRIGMYAYGSGCTGEFFSGVVSDNYRTKLLNSHTEMLENRSEIDYETYEKFYNATNDNEDLVLESISSAYFTLSEIKNHKRIYKKK